MRRDAASGFTLIELMVVVGIIMIMAAIAIPTMLRSKVQANETSAIAYLKVIAGAEVAYHASHSTYATQFSALTDATPPFLDGESTTRAGYAFALGGTTDNYEVTATPTGFGVTGSRGFYTDSTGVIRHAMGAAATADSPPVDEPAQQ